MLENTKAYSKNFTDHGVMYVITRYAEVRLKGIRQTKMTSEKKQQQYIGVKR